MRIMVFKMTIKVKFQLLFNLKKIKIYLRGRKVLNKKTILVDEDMAAVIPTSSNQEDEVVEPAVPILVDIKRILETVEQVQAVLKRNLVEAKRNLNEKVEEVVVDSNKIMAALKITTKVKVAEKIFEKI